MNKTELIAAVAEKADLSKKDAEAAITATVDAMTEALTQGEKVQLVGFGSFEVKTRAARVGRNPRTGRPFTLTRSLSQASLATVRRLMRRETLSHLSKRILCSLLSPAAAGC